MIATLPRPPRPRRNLVVRFAAVSAASASVLDIAAIEATDAPWADRLNAIAGWVYKTQGTERWADLARAWRDVRTLFGPASALRLLDLPELAALVDVEEHP